MALKFIDRTYEKAELEKHGKNTTVCHSWEEFYEATKNIKCGLVSPGGTGLPRDYVQRLEKEGLIKVFRVIVDDKDLQYEPLYFRYFYPSKAVYVYIPEDDVKPYKEQFLRGMFYGHNY